VKVMLETYGGLAAPITMRQPPVVLDTNHLAPEAEAEVSQLVQAAASTARPPKGSGLVSDAMSYTVTVDDGQRQITFNASDVTMSPEFAALLSWIRSHLSLH
jgi:hypothetical protein